MVGFQDFLKFPNPALVHKVLLRSHEIAKLWGDTYLYILHIWPLMIECVAARFKP